MKFKTLCLSLLTASFQLAWGSNQTPETSPILSESTLPYTIEINQAPFTLPSGIHSGIYGVHQGRWLLMAGRTNGMHGFGSDPFPPAKQNLTVYVVDFEGQTVHTRSLDDASSGLSQEQIDSLSVTSPQFFQNGKTLYMTGGYGVITATGDFETKPILTAIDLPKMMKWVIEGEGSAVSAVRQTTNPWVQVTGGVMAAVDRHLSALLIFGQNFTGVYTPSSNGDYTRQVRRLQIIDNGKDLYVQSRKSEEPNPSYRRRDLNIVPIVKGNRQGFVALSGVFTPSFGIWTVPVEIERDGSASMADPDEDSTFKQGMNNYVSANVTLYSPKEDANYMLLLGGITYVFFNGSTFETDTDFPFTNQATTVKRDSDGSYTQHYMEEQYPVILSTGSNPGNQLIFGAGAFFIPSQQVSQYPNKAVNFDKIKSETVVGYIVGGIMSTVPNTSSKSDSAASPYIFPVVVKPR